MSRVLSVALALLLATSAFARNVVFVDNSRAGGLGTYEKPFATIAEAQARSSMGDIIYVGEGSAPYEGGVRLQQGQQLIGAAEGLDDPHVPAVQGPGPTIHGSVTLAGDNVVAGLTIAADTATGISASSPHGPIAIRKVFLRPSRDAFALFLQNCTAPVTIEGGGLEAAAPANGIGIDGGAADITFDKFPIAGTFSSAVLIGNRTGGAVTFRHGSKISIENALRDAVVVQASQGLVAFDDPLRIATHGGRGLVVLKSDRVRVAGGSSRIAATNGAALEIRNAAFDGAFDSVSAAGVAPGKLTSGILLDKASGKLTVGGGTIENASGDAIRVEQSAAVQLSEMKLAGGGIHLRHVKNVKLTAVEISGGGGISSSNVEEAVFDRVRIAGAAKSALSLLEVVRSVSCVLCTFADAAGTPLVVEQHFHAARVSFDRLTITAAAAPTAAPYLVDVRVDGGARLRLDLDGAQLADSAGSAISLDAAGAGALDASVAQSWGRGLGGVFADVAAHQSAHVAFILREAHVALPGSRGRALVSVAAGTEAGDSATVCVGLAGNELSFGGGAPAVRIGAAGHSQVQMAGVVPPGVEIVAGTVVTPVGSCR